MRNARRIERAEDCDFRKRWKISYLIDADDVSLWRECQWRWRGACRHREQEPRNALRREAHDTRRWKAALRGASVSVSVRIGATTFCVPAYVSARISGWRWPVVRLARGNSQSLSTYGEVHHGRLLTEDVRVRLRAHGLCGVASRSAGRDNYRPRDERGGRAADFGSHGCRAPVNGSRH